MKILHLTLKKKWFDMIASGEKKEEYRELKPYWAKRLIDSSRYPSESKNDTQYVPENIVFDILNLHKPESVLKAYYSSLKKFDVIRFTNGYGKCAPTFD